jgi:Ni,Fe-hydrogenase III small subunit/ferredoxin
MFDKLFQSYSIWKHQGKQFIPDVTTIKIASAYHGRIEIGAQPCKEGCTFCAEACPTHAITLNPVTLDLGRCLLCGECVRGCGEDKFKFTNEYRMASNDRQMLIVKEGETGPIAYKPEDIRKEISEYFGGSLKLRQISAGGDSANEWELGAADNVNFDMSRFGIQFVASPRHADGIVITGPITENMANAVQICYDAIPHPKIIVLAGVEAISGGIYEGSPALNRSFLDKYKIDLYVPGNPIHPLTFVNGLLELIKKRP